MLWGAESRKRQLSGVEWKLEQDFPVSGGYHWIVDDGPVRISEFHPVEAHPARYVDVADIEGEVVAAHLEWWLHHRSYAPALLVAARKLGVRASESVALDSALDPEVAGSAARAIISAIRSGASGDSVVGALQSVSHRSSARQMLLLLNELPLPGGVRWEMHDDNTLMVRVIDPDEYGTVYRRRVGWLHSAMSCALEFAHWVLDHPVNPRAELFEKMVVSSRPEPVLSAFRAFGSLVDTVGGENVSDVLTAMLPLVHGRGVWSMEDVYLSITGSVPVVERGGRVVRSHLTATLSEDATTEAMMSCALNDSFLMRGPEFAAWAEKVVARARAALDSQELLAQRISGMIETEFLTDN